MADEPVIACRLTEPALAARLEALRRGLLGQVVRIAPIASGYRLELPNTDETADAVLDFVRFERQCCPFIDFGATLPAAGHPILLDLTGPDSAQEFIRVTFVERVTSGFVSP